MNLDIIHSLSLITLTLVVVISFRVEEKSYNYFE